jgi:peroxiredoxin/tetratricopeptide (TPR) repeat protein
MRFLPIAGLFALLPPFVSAQEPLLPASAPPLPGHSMHGESFNEGPRQAAVLMEGTGRVVFPVTTTSPEAQKFFTQGVGQLHGFWYFEAERSFRQAAALDRECAMAYWGMAMANINTPKRAAEFIKLAAAKKDKVTRREKLWIESLAAYHAEPKKGETLDESARRNALIQALEELSFEFPEDLEAKAFLVFQLWDNKQHKLPLPSRQAVDALAQQVLAVNPAHPIHHYLIHLWNHQKGDKHALPAASRCGPAAPGIAHMWHMPTHTYTNLRRHADAAWQLEASARVDHAHMAAARIMPEQIHNYAHNNEWLVRSLNHIGRAHDAVNLAKNLIELPRLGPTSPKAHNFGRERLLETLVRFEMWAELIGLEGSIYLPVATKPEEEARRLAALGVAYFQTGDTLRGAEKLAALEKLLERVRKDRVAAADAAETKAEGEKKSQDEIAKAMTQALSGFRYAISTTSAAIAEVKIFQALAAGKMDTAKSLLAKARDIPSERRSRIMLAIGDAKEAVKLARDAVNADPSQVQPLANLADLLRQTKQPQPARETFEKLRELSAAIDLDLPAFKRLAPLAAELKLPADWRLPAKPAADIGARPELATLGPFRWKPYVAPAWTLPNSQHQPHSLSEFRGRPVLVMFYLGSGCSHCIEQLNAFSPMTKDFAAAGIPMVAVSTDSPEGLHKTLEQAKTEGGFFFPILSDTSLATFKAYRAFDDFEGIPLHGTFLIDSDGFVRWQNIGYQPFSDAKWLLEEAKRLLSVPKPDTRTTARQ